MANLPCSVLMRELRKSAYVYDTKISK